MTESENCSLQLLLTASIPFLHIKDVARQDWCRVIKDPKNPRIGPWKYVAHFDVLNDSVWNCPGEVIYFVTDAAGRLRLVGQSMSRLKGRWKEAPMYDVCSKLPMGKRALFHTTSWPAIEKGFMSGEKPPFLVSALFRDKLEKICKTATGPLAATVRLREKHLHRLSYHVESWVCSLDFRPDKLWNKAKVDVPFFS